MSAICLECHAAFQPDTTFLQKLNLPSPSLCPNCRHKRRLTWRNDRTFFARKCDKTGQEFISMYPANSPLTVYHPDAFYSEDWCPLTYGRDIDFSRPFFDQFFELQKVVPRLGIDIVHCENSYFCNYCGDDKNCYLDIAGEANEDCYFNLFTKYSKNCADCTFVYNSELCYETIQAYNGYNLNFCINCDDSADCWFCYDLKGCRDCLFSTNLRQKQYHIFNKPYSQKEYEQKKAALDFGSYAGTKRALAQWHDFWQRSAFQRATNLINCENCTGNNLKNCKNTLFSFNAVNCEDCAHLYDVLDATDCQDLNYSLYHPEMSYELISTLKMRYSAFCMASHYCDHCYYCDLTNNSSHCFGCVGLKRNQYCILNKQYSPEEYLSLKKRLITHMQKNGEWGEFFPAEKSLWQYKETVANEYFPQETKPLIPLSTDHLPDHIKKTPDSILLEAPTCLNCNKPYRFIKQELTFYRKKNLPLPRTCPNCRHLNRIQLRPTRKLKPRFCANCQKTIQTALTKGLILCEDCYLKKMY